MLAKQPKLLDAVWMAACASLLRAFGLLSCKRGDNDGQSDIVLQYVLQHHRVEARKQADD